MTEALKAALDGALARGIGGRTVPGLVAAVTTADGTIYEGAFGHRALGGDVAMTPDTIFRIASLTKAVTASAVMQQVERGRLHLDAPAGDLVPYLRDVKVLAGYDAAGAPILRPPKTPLTLRHLLTHTSGFAYNTWSHEQKQFVIATGFAPVGFDNFRTPLMFDPGTRWQYGIGYDWAGQVLETVTNQRLADYAAEHLFAPLGMTAGWTVPVTERPRVARIHRRGPEGDLVVDPAEPPERLDYETGGGGLFTTAGDYLKFIRMILNRGTGNGHRVLSEASVALLSDPAASPSNVVTGLVTTDRMSSNPGEFFPGVRKRHSLGFMVNDEPAPTGRSPGSLAWAGFYNCYFWIDPKRNLGGVYMAQLAPFLDDIALPHFLEFETATYAALNA